MHGDLVGRKIELERIVVGRQLDTEESGIG
jgi:hypothetical protein